MKGDEVVYFLKERINLSLLFHFCKKIFPFKAPASVILIVFFAPLETNGANASFEEWYTAYNGESMPLSVAT